IVNEEADVGVDFVPSEGDIYVQVVTVLTTNVHVNDRAADDGFAVDDFARLGSAAHHDVTWTWTWRRRLLTKQPRDYSTQELRAYRDEHASGDQRCGSSAGEER